MKDRTKDVKDAFNEANGSLRPLYDAMEDDFRMCLGDQFTDAQKEELAKKGRPAVVVNHLLKAMKLITGQQKQSKSDIKVFPVEGGDNLKADIYTQLLKWIMVNSGGQYYSSIAFENAVTCGIGWLTVDMDYSNDPLNGDIVIGSESPFRVAFDPYMKNPDLSDCGYILRRKYMPKKTAMATWQEQATEIDKIKASTASPSTFTVQTPYVPDDRGNYIYVTEMWYREYEERSYIFDPSSRNVIEIPKGQAPEGFQVFTRRVPVIRMAMTCQDEITLYDDYSPYNMNRYPFFPVFGYYFPDFNDWEWKVQGIVRAMKDIQREKNKRHSQTMAAILEMPFSGLMFEEGAINDESQLKKPGPGKLIKLNPGGIQKIQQIQPPNLPNALITLEKMDDENLFRVGPNPDLMGEMQDKGAPGITIQLRQKQGMTSIQDIFDNYSMSQKQLGKYIIEIVNKNFQPWKVERILGQPLPPDFAANMGNDRYDCIYDEVASNPTYRISNAMVVMEMMRAGLPVPPQVVIAMTDLPDAVKEMWLQALMPPPVPPGGPGVPPGPPMPPG
jgi:hypothetical protein